jgi:hypothetical protein
VEIAAQPALAETDYEDLFKADLPDVSLRDNTMLAEAASTISMGFAQLQNTLLGKSPTLHKLAVDLMLKFAGEPKEDEILDQIISEAKSDPIEPVFMPGGPGMGNQP